MENNQRCQFLEGFFNITQSTSDVSGQAALTICESLMLALNDCKILPEKEILGILEDAASTHRNAADVGDNADFNNAVANLVESIIEGGNSVRRRQDDGPINAL